MAAVGFVKYNDDKKGKGRLVPIVKIDLSKIVQFDSGNAISFADANVHTLLFGTTGSGKTSSVILSSLNACIGNGFAGFVVDIKNNMTEKVKAIAKQHEREADVIELGSEFSAMPINILQGMDRHEIYDFLNGLMNSVVAEDDYNRHWHIKGLVVATDVAEMLLYLSKLDKQFTPTIGIIAQLMDSFEDSSKLFEQFENNKKLFVDKSTSLLKIDSFIASVKSNRFHIVNAEAKEQKSRGSNSNSNTFDEQTTWAFAAIRNALRNFLQTPGCLRNFGSASDASFNMQEAIEQKKVVVLRFNQAIGPMGSAIARYLTEQYYKAVYATGLKLPENEYSFVILDEFQQFADLTDARFSDASFVAQAREFNSIFMASTQSMSALITRKHDKYRVEQFVANCNNRIMFYSDDSMLHDMVAVHDKDIELTRLENGVFVLNYDSKNRQHKHSVESLQFSHDYMYELLKDVEENKELNLDTSYELEPLAKYHALLKKKTLPLSPPKQKVRDNRRNNKDLWDAIRFEF